MGSAWVEAGYTRPAILLSRVGGEGEARATILVLHTLKCMQISLSPISVLLRQPLSIKKELRRSCTQMKIKLNIPVTWIQITNKDLQRGMSCYSAFKINLWCKVTNLNVYFMSIWSCFISHVVSLEKKGLECRVLPWLAIGDFHHIMLSTDALCQQLVLTLAVEHLCWNHTCSKPF